MRFQEIGLDTRRRHDRRKLFSETGLWELVVEQHRDGLHLDLWWSRWPYGRVVGYCVTSEPGSEEQVLEALVHALAPVPEDTWGWDVEAHLPPGDEDPHPLHASPLARLLHRPSIDADEATEN